MNQLLNNMKKLLLITILGVLVLSGCGKEEVLKVSEVCPELIAIWTCEDKMMMNKIQRVEDKVKQLESHLNLTYIEDIDFIEEGYYENDRS